MRGGGKRFRARLLLAAFDAVGGTGDATGLAAAVELIHAYSLVHDDLPCMDDDDLRRGRPTLHRVYDTGTAMRAGLALLPLGIEAAMSGCKSLNLDDNRTTEIVTTILRAAGATGMISGQLRDLEGEGKALALSDLETIHGEKTGALIQASANIGGIAGGENDEQLSALDFFGQRIGLAFQIIDDVLDVTSTSAALGKTAGRDASLRKSTYPGLLGVEGASDRAQSLINEALDRLQNAGLLSNELKGLAGFIAARHS